MRPAMLATATATATATSHLLSFNMQCVVQTHARAFFITDPRRKRQASS
jgi:hypothetical protein